MFWSQQKRINMYHWSLNQQLFKLSSDYNLITTAIFSSAFSQRHISHDGKTKASLLKYSCVSQLITDLISWQHKSKLVFLFDFDQIKPGVYTRAFIFSDYPNELVHSLQNIFRFKHQMWVSDCKIILTFAEWAECCCSFYFRLLQFCYYRLRFLKL